MLGDKLPTSGDHVGKKPVDGYLREHSSFSVSSSLKNEADLTSILLVFFELVKNRNKRRVKTISDSLKFSTKWYFELSDLGSLKF